MADQHPNLYQAIMALGSNAEERAKALGITRRNLQRWLKRPPKYLADTPVPILEAVIRDRQPEPSQN
jgi:hypothetical protein